MAIDNPVKKRGRPRVETDRVEVRLHRTELDALDSERGNDTRPQAIRKIVQEKLGFGSPRT